MKTRIISLCLAIVLLWSMLPRLLLPATAATVASGNIGDNLEWSLDGGVLTISGTGDMCDFYTPYTEEYDVHERTSHSTSPWDRYRDQITFVNIMSGVTSVGQMAFYFCEKIEVISLPDTLTHIGIAAFMGCQNLKTINLPDSILSIDEDAFSSCDNLIELDLPNRLSTITKWMVDGCSNLTIKLPASINCIEANSGLASCKKILVDEDNPYFSTDEEGVLYNKDKTELVQIPDSLQKFTIPNGVKRIGDYAGGNHKLQEVVIPETVTSIGEYAFRMSGLTHVDIPGTVKEIERNAFANCEDLASASISDGVESLGIASFAFCPQLKDVYIPKSVSHIGGGAFVYCSAIDGIWVDDENQHFCNDSVGALYNKDKTELLQAPYWTHSSNYSIPQSVSSIGAEAFGGYEALTSIVIPKYVEVLHESVFDGCNNLKEVYFMGDAPTIKEECFLYLSLIVYFPENNNSWTNSILQNYGGELTWIAADIPNFYGFSLEKDGWSFANAAQSFAEEPVSNADDYFIRRERYDEVFGSAYVDATSGLYTEDWGGNCAGMSATAILFFLNDLDWENIDAMYTEDFANPNGFYRTVNLDHKSQSYYPAIGNNTEVTRLIEAYQLYINAINRSRLINNLENTYFAAEPEIGTYQGVTSENKPIVTMNYTYRHIPASEGGTYIASMLTEFQKAYTENTPLMIVLHGDDFGHGVVARTDLKPEDMGDGWWRVYVYDPNKPYMNESITNTVSGVEANPKYRYGCNTLIENGGDTYLELNPTLNQWRYCTSVNSNSSDRYIGSTASGELLWNGAYAKNENNEQYHVLCPDFFYTIDLTDFTMDDYATPHFDSTSAWIPENELAVAVNGDVNCTIHNSNGELVAIVENGEAFVLTAAGGFSSYIGQSKDGSSLGGTLLLPNDMYKVDYSSGNLQFLGNSNILSYSGEGNAALTIDIALNSLSIVAQEDGIVTVKCANVTSTDECSYVDTEGVLVAGETFSIEYSDEDKVAASTNSKNGKFQLYQKNVDQDEAVATKVIKSNELCWMWIVGSTVLAAVFTLFVFRWKKR